MVPSALVGETREARRGADEEREIADAGRLGLAWPALQRPVGRPIRKRLYEKVLYQALSEGPLHEQVTRGTPQRWSPLQQLTRRQMTCAKRAKHMMQTSTLLPQTNKESTNATTELTTGQATSSSSAGQQRKRSPCRAWKCILSNGASPSRAVKSALWGLVFVTSFSCLPVFPAAMQNLWSSSHVIRLCSAAIFPLCVCLRTP